MAKLAIMVWGAGWEYISATFRNGPTGYVCVVRTRGVVTVSVAVDDDRIGWVRCNGFRKEY